MLLLLLLLRPSGAVQVATATGVYQGLHAATRSGTPFHSFLGIKYASPVRFKLSVPVGPSWDLKNATRPGQACLQSKAGKKVGGEDCLFLNVFSPDLDGSLPVVVYIHGGSYMEGSAPTGCDLFMDTQRVVYVSIQFRLGILGFLDFNSEEYPSNLGLKDMVEALRWVRRNVRDFGGDPERITLEGESSGAVSVDLLLRSPLARGLFRSGVSQSGAGCALWATMPRDTSRRVLLQLARATKCPHRSLLREAAADDVARCLSRLLPDQLVVFTNHLLSHSGVRRLEALLRRLRGPLEQAVVKRLVETTQSRFSHKFPHMPFMPVLEPEPRRGAFIAGYPWDVAPPPLPWIYGVNSYESLNLIQTHGVSPTTLHFMLKYKLFEPALAYVFMYDDKARQPLDVTRRLENFYLEGQQLTDDNLFAFIHEMINDGMFNFPKYECLRQREGAPSWSFLFGYLRDSELRDGVPGVSHTEELGYLFENATYNVRVNGTQRDSQVSSTFVDLLVSFAENGAPSSKKLTWEKYDPATNRVLLVDTDGSFSMADDPRERHEKFWKTLKLRDGLTHS